MTTFSLIVLALLTLFAISLQRTYAQVPLNELKRRSRAGDQVATALHRAVAYGASLRTILWILVIVFAAIFFWRVSETTATWLAIVLSGALLFVGFVWLPARQATRFGVWLAAKAAPALDKLLQYLHPILDKAVRFIRRHQPISVHTGLYDIDDLLELFRRQKVQADNRIDRATLEIALHSLQFGDKKTADILIPRRAVKSISVSEVIGPVVLDDLHKSGHSRFPVYDGKQDNIVGVLYLRSLLQVKDGKTVRELMNKHVCYVHEDQPLTEVLQAILRTHQQLYIVVNSFEEYVGVVSIEDVLEQILGKQIVDEFDQYEDLRAVAAKTAKKEHEEHEEIHENIQSVTEVIE